MLSCFGARGCDGTALAALSFVRRDWVMRLLGWGVNIGETSSKSKLGQLQVQLCERRYRCSRCTEFHDRARGGVELHAGTTMTMPGNAST